MLKWDDCFPDSQFHIENYQFPPLLKERNSKGGSKIVYLRQGLISKMLKILESKASETVCIELTISKEMVCNVCL